MKKSGIIFGLAMFIALTGMAQTSDPFEEMQRQMQQMIQQLRSGQGFSMPKGGDSTFFFHIDTSFNNGNGNFFYRFGPAPGNGSMGDGTDMLDQMMRSFRNFSMPFDNGQWQQRGDQPPADDGGLRKEGDLLPEEKLRKEESDGQAPNEQPAAPPVKKDPPKQKIKTIRI
jgi:hypothetical protein